MCGESTEGVDTYVVCPDCVRDFETGLNRGMRLGSVRLYDELAHAPLTSADEASLRKLLDW